MTSEGEKGISLVKPNYQFEKRQRDLAKKQKQEQKRCQKLAGKAVTKGGDPGEGENTGEPASHDESHVPTDGAAKPEA